VILVQDPGLHRPRSQGAKSPLRPASSPSTKALAERKQTGLVAWPISTVRVSIGPLNICGRDGFRPIDQDSGSLNNAFSVAKDLGRGHQHRHVERKHVLLLQLSVGWNAWPASERCRGDQQGFHQDDQLQSLDRLGTLCRHRFHIHRHLGGVSKVSRNWCVKQFQMPSTELNQNSPSL